MKKWIPCFLLTAVLLASAACVPGTNTMEDTPDREGRVAGFFAGLWQGFISPITFIISIFTKKVNIYEVHNSGFWYNFGFVLGAGLFLNGGILGSRSARRAKRRR